MGNLMPICCRNCGYPQELVIGLSNVRRVQQIQLLSHEYKVRTCKTL